MFLKLLWIFILVIYFYFFKFSAFICILTNYDIITVQPKLVESWFDFKNLKPLFFSIY